MHRAICLRRRASAVAQARRSSTARGVHRDRERRPLGGRIEETLTVGAEAPIVETRVRAPGQLERYTLEAVPRRGTSDDVVGRLPGATLHRRTTRRRRMSDCTQYALTASTADEAQPIIDGMHQQLRRTRCRAWSCSTSGHRGSRAREIGIGADRAAAAWLINMIPRDGGDDAPPRRSPGFRPGSRDEQRE